MPEEEGVRRREDVEWWGDACVPGRHDAGRLASDKKERDIWPEELAVRTILEGWAYHIARILYWEKIIKARCCL